jgi:general secretion pathway protein C
MYDPDHASEGLPVWSLKLIRQPWGRRALFGAYLVLLAFVLAHSVNAYVAYSIEKPGDDPVVTPAQQDGSVEAPDPRILAQSILSGGLFALPANSTGLLLPDGSPAPPAAPPAPPLNAARKVSLIGTALNTTSGGLAILEDLSSKHQTLYHLHEAVPSLGTIADIQKSRILFREGDQEEWLELAIMHRSQDPSDTVSGAVPAASRRPLSPQLRVLDRRELAAFVDDPARLLTQAQAVPYLADGKLNGFRLYNVVPEGFFDKLGVQTNDIVQRINGVELRDPGMLLSLFRQLKNERTVSVDLLRLTQRQTLSYEIR